MADIYIEKEMNSEQEINSVQNENVQTDSNTIDLIEGAEANFPLSKRKKANTDGSGKVSNWKFDQDACERAMTRMIIRDELPFKFVEKDGFREFCKVVQPLIRNVSRTTIVKEIFKIYKSEKVKLEKLFRENVQRVCLTTDLWTSNQNIGYLCLTAHFIDSNWKLHKCIINFCILPSPHTGEAISNAIEECLDRWKIKQVTTITADNASTNDVALSTLRMKLRMKNGLLGDGESLHVRCAAHILNLVVMEGTDQIKDSIARIRNSVKWVKSSPSREQAFGKSCESVRIATKMSLCLDVSTRWNSTYLMLKHALPFEVAFKYLEVNDVSFRNSNPPLEEDWKHAKVLCDCLAKFLEAMDILSGTKYTTSNLLFREFDEITESLYAFPAEQNNPLLLRMCNKMKEKLAEYWGSTDKFNIYVLIACVLDPRYKTAVLEYCLKIYLPNHEVSAILKTVYDKMVALYRIYQAEVSCTSSSSKEVVVSHKVKTSHTRLQKFLQEIEQSSSYSNMSEIDVYLQEPLVQDGESFDILVWWSVATRFKTLACLARDILAIPVSTVASESAFSTGGRALDQYRSSLTPMLVEGLICTQDWLKAALKDLEYEEFVDQLDKCAREEDEADDVSSPCVTLPPLPPKH